MEFPIFFSIVLVSSTPDPHVPVSSFSVGWAGWRPELPVEATIRRAGAWSLPVMASFIEKKWGITITIDKEITWW